MNTVGWCAAWVAGCAVGLFTVGSARNSAGIEPLYGQAVLLLGLVCFLPLALCWPQKRARWVCLLAMAGLGGCGTALLIHPPVTPDNLAYYNGQPSSPRVTVIGEITGEPVLADRSQHFRFSAQQIRLPGDSVPHPIKGDLYVVAPRYPEYLIGARLALSGMVTAPPQLSDFDFAAYLGRQNILSYVSFPKITDLGTGNTDFFTLLLGNTKLAIKSAMQRGIPEPQAALTVGVVTGDRSGIPNDVRDAFARSGTTHIIAISGQNIALIIGVVWLLFGSNSKRRMTVWAFAIASFSIIIYTLFTGSTPSVVRAAIMGIILLFAPVARRRYDAVAALAIAATGMMMLDPDVLADEGFQLSFAAMLGIALLAQPFYTFFTNITKGKIPGFIIAPISVGLAAQLASMPLLALYFNMVSVVSLPATLTADIALLPLMAMGIAAGVLGAIFPPLGIDLGILTWPFAWWIIQSAQFWSTPSWAAFGITHPGIAWIISYYAFFAASVWLIYKAKSTPLQPTHFLKAAMTVLAVALWVELATIVFT